MPVLITLTQAKEALKIEHDEQDSQLLLRCEEASDIVMGYITNPLKTGWTDSTVPGRIRAAILMVLKSVWIQPEAEPLSKAVKDLLRRDRDPTLA